MNQQQLDAGIGEYQQTIMDLSARLSSMAVLLATERARNAELNSRIADLEKPKE